MTLTRRLTMMTVAWIALVLLIMNVIGLVWFRARTMDTFKDTLVLELSSVWKLAAELPHLASYNDRWERSAILTPSSIRFLTASGDVTSSVQDDQLSKAVLRDADRYWAPTAAADLKRYRLSENAQLLTARPGTQLPYPEITTIDVPKFVSLLPIYRYETPHGAEAILAVEEPILYSNGAPGRIVVASTLDQVQAQDGRFLQALLLADCVVVLLLSVGTYLVTERGLRPISNLIDSVRSLEWSRTTRVNTVGGAAEIETLSSTINQLLEQVEQGIVEQRRFVADASHELRTPLAIIAGHANLLRRWGNTNEQVWEPAVRHIVNEVERLQRLVDSLLTLSRLDAEPTLETGPLSLADVTHILQQLRADGEVLRPDLRWSVHIDVPWGIQLCIPASTLRQALVSIIDNSMRHTQSGGHVELQAVGKGARIHIAVADSGEGIPVHALEHVFDRFYRVERSRSRQRGGSGLGLSICKQMVERYGGRIFIESQVGIGTTVTLDFSAGGEGSKVLLGQS